MAAPLIVVDVVGLTARLLPLAPRISALASRGWTARLREVSPAVTCTVQATLLTGRLPREHGVVGNGWLYRDTQEVRFWQQSNRLLQAEPLYTTARRRAEAAGRSFRCAKLFWWFNQGADVDLSVTPKPYYGANGDKRFGILATPGDLAARIERDLGKFPFPTFWGPMAGLPSTEWIAKCAGWVLERERPDLTLVYLPHLDYDLQRYGPSGCDLKRVVGELDAACQPLLDAAQRAGARVWVLSEYAHLDVQEAILPNLALRRHGLLAVRDGPFGEQLDPFSSRAFAVCDHQIAHIYLNEKEVEPAVRECLARLSGLRLLTRDEKAAIALDHSRAGDIIALSEPGYWFAYPFWLDERHAPDYAPTVDIHRKPGYDPCELFFDPKLLWPRGKALFRLLQKKLGFRTLFDLVPLDPSLVRGSHGLPAPHTEDRPILVGDGPAPNHDLDQQSVRDLILQALA